MKNDSWKCLMLLLCVFFLIQGCKPNEKGPIDKVAVPQKNIDLTNLRIKKLVIPNELKLDKNINSNYFVIIVFDGNCSFCIKDFLELLKKIQGHKSKLKIKYVFISYSQDLFTIENYLEEYHINLDKDDILITDYERVFNEKYAFASGNPINIILSKKGGEIISMDNPFEHHQVMKKYVDLGIFTPDINKIEIE